MRYMGSKRRIAKYILPIILKDRKPEQLYVEPFVGGGNSFCLVGNPRLGMDSNPHVIQALHLIRDHPEMLPKCADDISPELYQQIKEDVKHPLHGYVGFACSFGGMYFRGRIKKEYPPGKTDRVEAQYRANVVQSKQLTLSSIQCRDFTTYRNPTDCIIYCDPPYEGTAEYGGNFDHIEFWDKCREWVKAGNKVFISEYKAPDDFVCVWEKETRTTLNTNNKKAVEKLFVHRSQV